VAFNTNTLQECDDQSLAYVILIHI